MREQPSGGQAQRGTGASYIQATEPRHSLALKFDIDLSFSLSLYVYTLEHERIKQQLARTLYC